MASHGHQAGFFLSFATFISPPMDATAPFLLYVLLLFIVLSSHIGLALMFRKAGESAWKAFVPGLNYYTWVRLLDKGIGWFIAMLVPILNVVAWLILAADSTRRFDRHGFWDGVLAMAFPYVYFPWLGTTDKARYISEADAAKKPRPAGREWADAAAFALIAATTVRMFFFEAYTIPTTSMEGSLLAGDFLFVSKFHYGPRVPMTPLAIPFLHQRIPVLGAKAYLDKPAFPYWRMPGFQRVKRNDVVVFNWPEGDTIFNPFGSTRSYYDFQREFEDKAFYQDQDIVNLLNRQPSLPYATPGTLRPGKDLITAYPVDKRENYIKRCVGVPGDLVEMRRGELWVGGKTALKPRDMQHRYRIDLQPNQYLPLDFLKKELRLNVTSGETEIASMRQNREGKQMISGTVFVQADSSQAERLRERPEILRMSRAGRIGDDPTATFPHDARFPGNVDNFGPITVPGKGATVTITEANLPIYARIINVFEASEYAGAAYPAFRKRIAAGESIPYTFSMDYYLMMGDNRHQSQDGRYWGFVPEDHVLGKAWFVWWSWEVGIPIWQKIGTLRLNRLVSPVRHGK